MKKSLLTLAVVGVLAAGQNAYATSVTTNYIDNSKVYEGWNFLAGQDELGSPKFASTDVTMDDYLLESIRFNLSQSNTTVFSGDLLLDANADNVWDYVVKSAGQSLLGTSTPVSLGLYSINVDLMSSTAYTLASGYGVRAGHPTGLNFTPAETDRVGNVNYSVLFDGTYSYSPSKITFDFMDRFFLNDTFTIGYTISCANDVIEQDVNPVPEPATFVMLGAGLLGLGLYGRRKKQL